MTTAPVNQRRWSRFGLLFLAAILCYALLTFLGWMLGAVVVKRFPENYDWQVRAALHNGNLEKAEAIARRRVQKEHYDFRSHRLLASVLMQAGKPQDSVDVITMSLNRMQTASGRPVYTLGADPAETYQLLSAALQSAGHKSYAKEAAAIAADYQAIAAVTDGVSSESQEIHTQGPTPEVVVSGTTAPLENFRLNGAVTITTSGTLTYTGAGTAKANLQSLLNDDTSTLALQLAGSKALGIGAILKITFGEKEIFRAYAPQPYPRWVFVPLEKTAGSASPVITLEFINDAFDPVTQSDRNVEVLKVLIQ